MTTNNKQTMLYNNMKLKVARHNLISFSDNLDKWHLLTNLLYTSFSIGYSFYKLQLNRII